jgi:hypothetical protein
VCTNAVGLRPKRKQFVSSRGKNSTLALLYEISEEDLVNGLNAIRNPETNEVYLVNIFDNVMIFSKCFNSLVCREFCGIMVYLFARLDAMAII